MLSWCIAVVRYVNMMQIALFDHEAVTRALNLATLSPNSSNMQLWQFHRVVSDDKREQLAKLCMGQNAAKTARELIVIYDIL